jgi:hypothetical protein
MKTYRQQLRVWLNEEKESVNNEKIIDFIEKLQNQIKLQWHLFKNISKSK